MNCQEMFDQYESRLRALYMRYPDHADKITDRLKMVARWVNWVDREPDSGPSFVRRYSHLLQSDAVFVEAMLELSKSKFKAVFCDKTPPDATMDEGPAFNLGLKRVTAFKGVLEDKVMPDANFARKSELTRIGDALSEVSVGLFNPPDHSSIFEAMRALAQIKNQNADSEEDGFKIFLISNLEKIEVESENKTPSGLNTPDVLSKSKVQDVRMVTISFDHNKFCVVPRDEYDDLKAHYKKVVSQ